LDDLTLNASSRAIAVDDLTLNASSRAIAGTGTVVLAVIVRGWLP
jgi:hypothetical protein